MTKVVARNDNSSRQTGNVRRNGKNPFADQGISDHDYELFKQAGMTDGQIRNRLAEVQDKEDQSQSEDYVKMLMDDAHMTREQAIAAVDKVLGEQMPGLNQAADAASMRNDLAIRGLDEYLKKHPGADPTAYVGDMTSEAANAAADPRARQAQFGALDKLDKYTTENLTPEERFMMAQARATQERDMRAGRDATQRSLAARGANSGTAEMAGFLGSSAITNQNRMLSDLGAMANAQKRAIDATTAYGNQANTLGEQTFNEDFSTKSAADTATRFNNQLRTDYNLATDKFKEDQRIAGIDTVQDIADRRTKAGETAFDRKNQVTNTALVGSGQKVSALTGGEVPDALKIALGQTEADKAEAVLANKDKRFNLFDTSTW
jgi:hypothetical protein